MNFKKTMLASLLMISASGAFAANAPATLNVKGAITPAACDVTIGGGTESTLTFDVGGYAGEQKTLPAQSVEYGITCDAPSLAFISTIDTKSDTIASGAPVNDALGLGKDADENNIGWFTLSAAPTMTLDNVPAKIIDRVGGGTWKSVPVAYYHSTRDISFMLQADTIVAPKAFTQMAGTVLATPTIVRGLSQTDSIDMDGSITLTVNNI